MKLLTSLHLASRRRSPSTRS